MYGSSFWIETLIPRALSSRPSEAAVMPLPSELTTPPVKKIYFAISGCLYSGLRDRLPSQTGKAAVCTHVSRKPRVVALDRDALERPGAIEQRGERGDVRRPRFKEHEAARTCERSEFGHEAPIEIQPVVAAVERRA